MRPIEIDLQKNPNLHFRIDSFIVPDVSRAEFEASMRQNMAFIESLPGFRGHIVFERTSGPTAFNVVTIAVWDDAAALENAKNEVLAYYEKIGFDPPVKLDQWGVKAELGNFNAPANKQ